ncbi:MAG: hypothetical protein SYC29_00960 [Planctomycetota bacterium]|nr:hypothetical protein [Planctomycetota bacterium]
MRRVLRLEEERLEEERLEEERLEDLKTWRLGDLEAWRVGGLRGCGLRRFLFSVHSFSFLLTRVR